MPHLTFLLLEFVICIQKIKNMKAPRELNFINQFASGHQLVRQTQQYRIYNHKGKIIIQ